MSICTAMTKSGRPCKAHAVHDSDPPRCVVHVEKRPSPPTANFYDALFTPEEIADLIAQAIKDSKPLVDEIGIVRVTTRRVMEGLHQELEPSEYVKIARQVISGAESIARLLRSQRVITGETADSIAGVIGQALELFGEEIGLDL